MLASLNFIEKFISLPKKKYDVVVNGKKITKTIFDTSFIVPILTRQGFEVESSRHFGGEFDTVVVGRIERFEKHPDAHRLNICFVNINETDAQLRQIVCGAANVYAGMYVAVALPGTQLPIVSKSDSDSKNKKTDESAPTTFEIKSSVIRNVKSDGMLCARSELGLSINSDVDGDGIWDLSDNAQGGASAEHLAKNLGHPVFMTIGLEDTLLELAVTPNRPDALCQRGVARELAAGFEYTGVAFERRSFDFSSVSKISSDGILNDVIHNSVGKCAHIEFEAYNYLEVNTFFVLLEFTKPQNKTPAWLRNLLEPLGQNSINLVVDVSNFILVAYGQPNHAFDLDSIDSKNSTHKKLVLRHANTQEQFLGLDGQERLLHETDCVVSDSTTVQALLGVFGGQHSKISNNTQKIVVEFANPISSAVRHTARRHCKQTTASFMFEKGIDIESRFYAAAEFTGLLSHLNQDNLKYCTSVHSKNLENNPVVKTTFQKTWLPLHSDDQKKILGIDLISFENQIAILKSLGFDVLFNQDSTMIGVPSWRLNDVVDTADLIEEFVRVHGIDHVPPVPIDIVGIVNNDDINVSLNHKVSEHLCALGYHEVMGLNFMRENDYEKLNLDSLNALGEPVTILNPVLGDEPLMQTTLIPDLFRKVERNLNYGVKSGQLFRSARTFQKTDETSLPIETQRISGVCFGNKVQKTWQNSGAQLWTLHDIMMHITSLGQSLNIPISFTQMSQSPFKSSLHPKKQVEFFVNENKNKNLIGWLGELHPKVKRAYSLENTDVYLFELNFDQFIKAHLSSKTFIKKTFLNSRFPLLSRDFSFILPKNVSAKEIESCLHIALHDMFESILFASLKKVQIFDIYYGENVASNKKSVTFRVIVEPLQKTFTDSDIQIFSNAVVNAVTKQLAGEQRT